MPMRALALIAFVSLQLSMLTCGIDIHVHGLDDAQTRIAHHQDGANGQGSGLIDHACHLHATHVFLDQKPYTLDTIELFPELAHDLAALNFTSVPHLIEHPPKHLHG